MNYFEIFGKIEVSKINSIIVCKWQIFLSLLKANGRGDKPLFFCCIGRNETMKNIIIGIIIGGIIFGTIGVVVSTLISSKNVSYQNKTVNTALDELYNEAVTGKELVAAAITNKGVATMSTDTYETMATNISSIDTDHTEINQKMNNLESKHNSDFSTITGSISSLNQNLTNLNEGNNFKIISKANVFVGLNSGESKSVTISIDTSGYYLLVFSVTHCGANAITSTDPYWTVEAPFAFSFHRKILAIPIAKVWDDVSGTESYISGLDKGDYTFNFTNNTGFKTSDTYNSTVTVAAVMIK